MQCSRPKAGSQGPRERSPGFTISITVSAGLRPQPTDLRLALTEAGKGTIGSFGDQLLLLCYHYDPETGTYSSLVWGMLRVGGVLTVAGLGGFLGLAFWRERRARGG